MKKLIGSSLVAIAATLSFSGSASAADVQNAQPVVQEAQSPWQIRVRALGVVPRDKGRVHHVPGSEMDFSSTVVPELDITYYFTNNIAAELILGTTYSSIDGRGSLAGIGKIGKTFILPPTLTLQYHFTDFGAFKPYVGAGVNYTIFYNQDGNGADRGSGRRITGLDIDNTWGGALQVGFDYMLDQHWGFNFDVKKLYLRPDFSAKLNGDKISGKADLDPWLIGAGVTYRF